MERVILHLDMDAFYAAVEQMDNPELQGKPVIVGGRGERGVVSTCSYEARKYGVHSAMPGFMARQKCPNGIFLPVRMKRYKDVSRQIFQILYQYTKIIEPLSIDEAFLDISTHKKDYLSIVKGIKQNISNKTGLTVSAGVSYNKFLAKLASDWKKPDGLMVITEDMIPDILLPLSISKIYGLGKKRVKKLNALGVFSVEDLMKWPKEYMLQFFGKQGEELYGLIRGIDDREVMTQRETKSIGRETTLDVDTDNIDELLEHLKAFAIHVSYSLRVNKLYAYTVTIKIKTSKFASHTKSKTLEVPVNKSTDIFKEAEELMKLMDIKDKIRLIGLSVSNISEGLEQQISIFD
ncbi:MAG: DNA polymerase IV [Clostridia bacterium]|nr:DNA polymerase IV [Clostridia bacterium]